MSEDWRTANPDDLDHLADLMWTPDDGGTYGELTDLFRRAREADATAEMASLTSLQTWLRDAAIQLRENAYILRNDHDKDGIVDRPLYASGNRPSYIPEGSPFQAEGLQLADWQVEAKTKAEEFVSVSGKDEFTDEDVALLAGYMDGNASDPAFAEAVIDDLGMEEFLRLAERVESMDGSEHLLASMGTALAAAMRVPARPGTVAYERWTEENPEGQRYLERLDAFNEAGAQQLGSDDSLGYDIAFDLLGRSRISIDQEFFDQTLSYLNAPYRTADDDAPWPENMADELMIAASLSSPDVVDHHLFSSYGGRGLTEAKIQWTNEMLARGEELTDRERAQLSAVLAANQDDPTFAREVITNMSAEELLQSWVDLMAPGTETPTEKQRRIHTSLDQNLGAVLGHATRTGIDEQDGAQSDQNLEQWEQDLIAASEEVIASGDWSVWGFQIIGSLLGNGDYDPNFLTSYGDSLLQWENSLGWNGWSYNIPDKFNPMTEDFTWDPVVGFCQGLANDETAAAVFLGSDRTTLGDGDKNNFSYLADRPWPTDENAHPGQDAFYDALVLATEGERTADRVSTVENMINYYGSHTEKISDENSQILANVAANYMHDIQYSLTEIDSLPAHEHVAMPDMRVTAWFLSKLGRSPEAYAVLIDSQEAYTAVAIDHVISTSEPDSITTRVDLVASAGGRIAGILTQARAIAVEENIVESDEEFNERLSTGEQWAQRLVQLGTETIEKIPVAGTIAEWIFEDITASLSGSLEEDSGVEAAQSAHQVVMLGEERVGDSTASVTEVAAREAGLSPDSIEVLTDLAKNSSREAHTIGIRYAPPSGN
jgi:hypothetical protein